MLRSRVIPSLLVENGRLVKTVNFDKPQYVGDPLNAVRIFNEKQVDELAVFDVSATPNGREPDYDLIEKLASVSRMPLCYGGGVKKVQHFERIVSLGVEKVAVASGAIDDPELIHAAVVAVGSQSVAVVLDVRAVGGDRYRVFVDRGRKDTGLDAVEFARRCEAAGVGEIIVNSIDRDGTMKGFDMPLVRLMRSSVSVPMTVLGGAGSREDLATVLSEFYPIGVAAGSMFVFKGRFKAVLINYPNPQDKDALPGIVRARPAAAQG
jgi:cyclase